MTAPSTVAIPVVAWEAAVAAWNETWRKNRNGDDALLAAIAALHNNWPGMHTARDFGDLRLVLPLSEGVKT